MNMKTDITTKTNEAELYLSMGLVMESLNIYEKILSDTPELDQESRENILEKVDLLKKKIENKEETKPERLSKEDISIIKETLATGEDLTAINDSAAAFKELGLFEDAISEYENLLKQGYPLIKIIHAFFECCLKLYSPLDAVSKIKGMITEKDIDDHEKGEILFILGMEMENRSDKALATDLYQSAMGAHPENEEIRNKLKSMMASLSTGSRYEYLLNQNMVDTDQLKKALDLSKKRNKSVEFILIEQFKIKKDEIGKSLSLFYGRPFKSYSDEIATPVELISNLKKPFLLQEHWVPLSWDKDSMEILVDDPKNLTKTDNIRSLLRGKIDFSIGIKEDIEEFINLFFDEKRQEKIDSDEAGTEDFDLIPDVSFEEEEEGEDGDEDHDEASGQVVKIVDQVLVAAYRKNASDIHIEPSPVTKATTIRFRMDGVCQEYIQIPNSLARGILSRIKIMAGLDIAERRLPQDGKIKFKRKGIPPFELRVATLPTAGGFEDSVLRILAKAGAMELDKMGLLERNLNVLKKIIFQPYGLVLVVGPTGSGKTTSLHAALGHINKPDVKIWTAEDPVEITQQGLRQVEAKPKIGLDFSRIMRAFLRADPDIIMIGEMRDEETASIGIEASLTGHLVFSTLHTNSAPETITRLLDMGLNPLNFSDAFLGVMAQRLARRLCSNCREAFHPSEEEFEDIVTDYGKEYFLNTGIELTPDLTLYRTKGCDKCSGVGYKGRLGIHELMEGTPEIKSMIKKQASSEMLFGQAMKEGMTTLKQDGILKVFQGITDIHEIRRICVS